jgi:streptogramin lyase
LLLLLLGVALYFVVRRFRRRKGVATKPDTSAQNIVKSSPLSAEAANSGVLIGRDAFISYRSEDRSAAERICASLERENISCWIAPRDIQPGKEWATAIVEAIQSARVLIVVLSSNSRNARQIAREAELADKQGLTIITFRVENVEPPPALSYFLGDLQWLDGFGEQFNDAAARLAKVVREIGRKSTPLQLTQATPAAAEAEGRRARSWGPSAKKKVYFGLLLTAIAIAIICFTYFTPSPKEESATLRILMASSDGSLWAGFDDGGLARLAANNTWESFTRANTYGRLPSDSVHALAEGPDGSLWVGTGAGLARLDKLGNWESYTKASTNGGLPSDVVEYHGLAGGPDGFLWIATHSGGLARLDKDGHWQTYTQASTNGGLPEDDISGLAFTLDGSLWLGTYHGGLTRLDKDGNWQTYPKKTTEGLGYDIRGLACGSDGSLWVGIGGVGLAQLDKDGSWHNYTKFSTKGGLPTDRVKDVVPGADGSIWVTTGFGLTQLDKGGRWQTYTQASTKGGLPSDAVITMADGPDGSLWIATYSGGLARLDKDGRWQNYRIKAWPVRTM